MSRTSSEPAAVVLLDLWAFVAPGAPVGVLRPRSLGSRSCDLPTEEGGRPGADAEGGLPGPGGWSGARRLCSGESE